MVNGSITKEGTLSVELREQDAQEEQGYPSLSKFKQEQYIEEGREEVKPVTYGVIVLDLRRFLKLV